MITITLTEGSMKPFQDALSAEMTKSVKHFERTDHYQKWSCASFYGGKY